MNILGYELVLHQSVNGPNRYYWMKDKKPVNLVNSIDSIVPKWLSYSEQEAIDDLLWYLGLTEKDHFNNKYKNKLEDLIDDNN